jgi:enoyl-[acyl-carrier protein] reductase I
MSMGGLVEGKRGLVMGVANEKSIAWGCARVLHAQGAELAFTYQGDRFGKRVEPLAASIGATLVMPADVQDEASMDAVFARIAAEWGKLDFVIHAIAYSDKDELHGRYADTTRANFLNSLDISCFSLVDVARRAAPLMTDGGAIVTMTYLGAQRVMPNYNVMGVAKAALEASVRYLANDLGADGIRVNALSPGPMRTLAGAAVGSARKNYREAESNAPMQRNAELDHVGGAAAWLCSDFGGSTTGDVIFVDGGYHALGMRRVENL